MCVYVCVYTVQYRSGVRGHKRFRVNRVVHVTRVLYPRGIKFQPLLFELVLFMSLADYYYYYHYYCQNRMYRQLLSLHH